jgi:hypothetical protein
MIKITYKESSVECSTKEEAECVLRVLNEIRKENAAKISCSPGLVTTVAPAEPMKDVNQRVFNESRKPKPKVI